MFDVQIVADSINTAGERIISCAWTYPFVIHGEVMTHRVFARNALSKRAIPVKKLLDRVINTPYIPLYWGRNQAGMQASVELEGKERDDAIAVWLSARDFAVKRAQELVDLDCHKQIANRVIEPFSWMTTIITSTEWANFFRLRAHKDAEPHMQRLAYLMLKRYMASTPRLVQDGDWHLPFADKHAEGLCLEDKLKVSTARSARVSYLNHDGEIVHTKDYELVERLAGSIPGHWSPFEHPAQATPGVRSGCYTGWKPFRKTFPQENLTEFDGNAILAACPFKDWLDAQ